jgi:hypothetical protein
MCLTDVFLLEANPGLGPSLEKYIIAESVVIEDVTAMLGEWLVVSEAGTRRGRRKNSMDKQDNAPFGRMNEWTSPMAILEVGLVRDAVAASRHNPDYGFDWLPDAAASRHG